MTAAKHASPTATMRQNALTYLSPRGSVLLHWSRAPSARWGVPHRRHTVLGEGCTLVRLPSVVRGSLEVEGSHQPCHYCPVLLRAFLALGRVLHHLPYCTILPIHQQGRRRRGNPAPVTGRPRCSLQSTCGPRACFHTH
eukprot:488313-Rhodomonas_salina.1